ncbi:3711_t:CDS:10 [Acaulospora colombiana]|uniref:3711_t:CDS:1 n=1 Tax=Acaulospora colombiana TaxID=27376 RepID=A0ACA9JVD3_9GLOM|nr:3711_t:CDS:10 [Acaulospora colombiana]
METKILSSYQLPRPTGKLLIICVVSSDWVAVKVLSNRVHVFFKETLKEIWNFSEDPVEILRDGLYMSLDAQIDSSASFLVLTSDGSIWRIQSSVQKKRRSLEAGLNENIDSPLRQVRRVNEVSGENAALQPLAPITTPSNDLSTELHSCLSPPSIVTVTESHKKDICELRSSYLFNTHGIVMMCQDGEIGFLSLTNQIPTNQIIRHPEMSTRSDSQSREITCSLTGNIDDSTSNSPSPISSELALIAFGAPNLQQEMLLTGYSNGLICYQSLVTNASSPGVVTALKEPIQSIYTLSLKRELVDESRVIRRTPATEKLHNAFLIVGAQCTIALMAAVKGSSEDSNKKSIAYKEYYVPEPIYSSFLFRHLMNRSEMESEIKVKLNKIAELSALQDEMEKTNELLNEAISARNMIIPEFQRLYKRRDSATDNKNPPLKVELIVRMMNLNPPDPRSSKNSKDSFPVMSYSVSLGDMAVIWERDIEINLRFLQFPILIKLGMCFSPPTPTGVSNEGHYQSKSSYFSLVNIQYDILDFIKPCSVNALQRLQNERHFAVYPAMPEFVSSLDGDFFATKSDFRRTLESIISIHGSNTIREDKPISDFISSLNCGSAAIKFFLRAGSNGDSKQTDSADIGIDSAFDRSKLQEIVIKSDYAVFTTPLSLEPVIINFKRLVDGNCINKPVPSNSIPVELRIKCSSVEILLLVEEAILTRLEDFSLKDEEDVMETDEPARPLVDQKMKDKIFSIRHKRDDLVKLHEIHADPNVENPVAWEDLLKMAEQLETDIKEVVVTVRNGMDGMWLNGVVEL